MSDSQVSFATQGSAIGFISKITGSVTIQSIDGQERVVKVGDPVFFGETVLTGASASVVISFVDGTEVEIGRESVVEITNEVYNTGDNEELVADSSTDPNALQQAILSGQDPTQIQDAPAAGDAQAEQDRFDVDIDRNDNSAQPTFGADSFNALPTFGNDTDVNSFGRGQQNESTYQAPSTSTRSSITSSGESTPNPSTVNQAPTVENQQASVTEDLTISGTISATDLDLPADKTLTFTTTSTVTGLTFNSDGSYSFDASSYDELSVGEKKEISINVIATDDQGSQGTGQLNITVTGTNDAPVAQASAAIVREGSIVSGAVTAEDVDLPADASLTFTLSEEVKGLTFNENGTYQFDASNEAYSNLAAGERLTLKIPVTVTDDQGATDTTRLTINIVGTDDAPEVAGTFTGAVTEGNEGDAAVTATGTISISDVDADDSPAFADTTSPVQGTYGSLTLVDGAWTYTLDQSKVQDLDGAKDGQPADQVTDTITLTADDGTTQDIVITITGTDDA
ncbi:hypothetical protein C0J08_08390, partial [Marinomonas sp. CT5]|uniref:retention module-containing protein n=1 Tax=Marinomonas sp. CT5 TaxID=2066133 RepID=UPI001BAEC21C